MREVAGLPHFGRACFAVLGLLALVPLALADPPEASDDRDHWAFQPVHTPEIPAVKQAGWCRNPIDRFVLAKLEEEGWTPAPPAKPPVLLRRLAFDLIGLPPTPEQIAAFPQGDADEAADRLVDELLARPEYGERWARHWLDVVRFAESNGYERDAAKPSAWRYRDYVIRAFNRDERFDRFIVEQLAGDELDDTDAETVIATTYYRLGPWDDEPADPKQDRFDQLDDIVSTTSEVFLGLTLGCARCHDHKFEPLTQRDYYGMVAVFNGLKRPQTGRMELEVPAGSPAEVRAASERDETIALLQARSTVRRARPIGLASVVGMGGVAPWLLDAVTRGAEVHAVARLRAEAAHLPSAYVFRETSPKPPVTRLLLRGQAASPGPEVGPAVPAVLTEKPVAFSAVGSRTSLRRLTLARWLARPEHPLTARVIVNRIWQHHFGEGLVRTSGDFGTMGEAPTHPELLDWLADWFVRHDWSIKALHRIILTSQTYRMSAAGNPEYAAEDPENRLLWRSTYRRLDAEVIRDAMLTASGRLNRAFYGPSMYPPIPREALEGHSDPDKAWKPSPERDASRRTIYAFVKRSLPMPMMEVLDFCDTARPASKRNVTSVAPQALTLLNSDFVNLQARYFADRLEREAGDNATGQVERAFLIALGRRPTDAERTATLRFLDDTSARITREQRGGTTPSARRVALEQLCRAIFNTNEFVFPD